MDRLSSTVGWPASAQQRPVVLVVDDLHWADQSTLDVLMYVLAGLADRRLAVLATIRSGEVTENHPLRRWLADVRRLPGVSELRLDRLDRAATGEQMTGLLGGPPHEALVDQIYARTDGNAYLTTLLARGLPPDARSLPAGLPTELGDAATRAWRSLSSPAQALTRLIAVAGRPQRSDQLGKIGGADRADRRRGAFASRSGRWCRAPRGRIRNLLVRAPAAGRGAGGGPASRGAARSARSIRRSTGWILGLAGRCRHRAGRGSRRSSLPRRSSRRGVSMGVARFRGGRAGRRRQGDAAAASSGIRPVAGGSQRRTIPP